MDPANVPRLFDEALWRRLEAVASVAPEPVITDFGAARAVEALADCEVLLTCWGCPPVDAGALASAPRLAAVVHAAGSIKRLIAPEAWDRGIRVTSAVAANAVPVAEYTVAMIVLANKRVLPIAELYREHRDGDGFRSGRARYPDIGNYGKTVGILGASRVGRRVVDLLRSYDLELLLADPTLTEADGRALGVRLVDLDTLVSRSDVVSIHAPDIPATRHLIDKRRLGLLRDGATLINTARGRLVDTEALTAELATGRIGAVLDVTDPEPLSVDSPLFDLPNVLLTPHVAGSLGCEVRRMAALAVEEIERYARGEEFAHPVRVEDLESLA